MTSLALKALARHPMDAATIERCYACEFHAPDRNLALVVAIRTIKDLCESHERLRFELEGAKALIERLNSDKKG